MAKPHARNCFGDVLDSMVDDIILFAVLCRCLHAYMDATRGRDYSIHGDNRAIQPPAFIGWVGLALCRWLYLIKLDGVFMLQDSSRRRMLKISSPSIIQGACP